MTNWLNAYNAPHWMDIGSQMQYQLQTNRITIVAQPNYSIAGWVNRQIGETAESYGTSWMRDLMAAKQYAPAGLLQSQSWFNGGVDANHGYTPFTHKTHDLGMAFDLGVSNYIAPRGAQTYQFEQLITQINQLPAGSWSVADPVANSEYLNSTIDPLNNQRAALRDFLSLYAVTQSKSWGAMFTHVVNGTAARDALFGSGAQDAKQLISKVVIGGTGNQNPYPNIHKVLDSLGVTMDPNASNHNSHFHVYLNTPKIKGISANLLADEALLGSTESTTSTTTLQAEAQALLDYAEALTDAGDELMFTMDVPYVPMQDTAIVLAQAATAGAMPQPDFILNDCQDTESTGDPMSAMRGVDPASLLKVYIENKVRHYVDIAAIKNITLLEGTEHGVLNAGASGSGRTYYMYAPKPGYVGSDKAVFMAEYEGKRYKIVVQLNVFLMVDEKVPSTCPPPKLIKVNGKPVSDGGTYQLNSFTLTFGELPGGAVGKTTGTEITLDLTAAGHGWYIDPTPLDNSDDYLPTSNPSSIFLSRHSTFHDKGSVVRLMLRS